MPLYEYQCTACGKLTEKRQKFSDPELTECPYCGGRLERTITAPAVQFKGGGWYADLYSSGKKPAANAPAEGSGSGDASKPGETAKSESGGTKSESTPAPAAPSSAPSTSASTSSPTNTPTK